MCIGLKTTHYTRLAVHRHPLFRSGFASQACDTRAVSVAKDHCLHCERHAAIPAMLRSDGGGRLTFHGRPVRRIPVRAASKIVLGRRLRARFAVVPLPRVRARHARCREFAERHGSGSHRRTQLSQHAMIEYAHTPVPGQGGQGAGHFGHKTFRHQDTSAPTLSGITGGSASCRNCPGSIVSRLFVDLTPK